MPNATRPCPSCAGTGKVLDSQAVGAEMRAARELAGLSLREAAKAAHYSPSYLSDLELGRRKWTPARQERVMKAIRR